eukprot:1590980-Rhodomonas_salina.1
MALPTRSAGLELVDSAVEVVDDLWERLGLQAVVALVVLEELDARGKRSGSADALEVQGADVELGALLHQLVLDLEHGRPALVDALQEHEERGADAGDEALRRLHRDHVLLDAHVALCISTRHPSAVHALPPSSLRAKTPARLTQQPGTGRGEGGLERGGADLDDDGEEEVEHEEERGDQEEEHQDGEEGVGLAESGRQLSHQEPQLRRRRHRKGRKGLRRR